jgi:site-specific recombinase XerD
MTVQLTPIDVEDAIELYINDIDGELSPNTVQAKEYRLGFFQRWCDENEITDMNDLNGRALLRYKQWRSQDINNVTLHTQLSELRVFLEFCVTIDGVDSELPSKVQLPDVQPQENVRDTFMDTETALQIIEFLGTYHYASLDHITFLLLWETGARISAIHSLDVNDVETQNNRIQIKHRPSEGTRLKKGDKGERIVTVPQTTIDVLKDYIEVNRHNVTDKYDRKPLCTTQNGRIDKRHLAKHIYQWTCPCQYNESCPSDREPIDCEHTDSYDKSVECPHNVRPHDIRRGSITHWLKEDTPTRAVSDRMNVSVDTLDKHYDKRSEATRAEQRRRFFTDDE